MSGAGAIGTGRTLLDHGVTELATRNARDFEGFGFVRVFDPVGGAV